MSENAIVITDATFDELVNKSDKPVVVDFWAPGAALVGQLPQSWTSLPVNTPTRSPSEK